MNMRDAMGSLGLRHLRMSSQPEALVSWLLEVQSIMVAAADASAPSAPYVPSLPIGGYPGELDSHGDGFADQGNPMRDWMPPPTPHEEAVAGAQAARLRNAGSFTFGHEPGLGSMPPPPSSRGGRGAVVGQECAYSTGRNPITAGEWGDGGGVLHPGGRGAVVGQEGAYSTGRNPITAGEWGDGGGVLHPGGRGAVVGQEGAYSTGRNPITAGEWGDGGGVMHPGGRGAVVGQDGAYSTGRNPIMGGPGEWGGGGDMWARPTSARIRQVGASDVGHGPGMHRPASPGAASHCSDVSHRQAHEDSLAGAHAARIRNQGSFAFG